MATRDPHFFMYVVKVDSGFAPNPVGGLCTLACCKPTIRKTANVGDWIIGTTPSPDSGKVIYESVDLIAFWFDVEINGKFYHRHIVDIPRIKFFI